MNFNMGNITFTDELRLFLAQSGEAKSTLMFDLFGFITLHMNCRFNETVTPDWIAEQNISRVERGVGDIFSEFEFVIINDKQVFLQIHTDLNGDNSFTRIGFAGQFTIV